ncbi:MAG: hypothetical protein LBD17_04000 [Endomicrobium sp.]|jgi:hypothetical protein|nr:hypothetical protein [Endomicrobium sp.]
MLEIIALIILINVNAKNAGKRGRKGWPFALLTLIMWIGFEILGAVIGNIASEGHTVPTYLTALVFAIIGGIVSYLIAKNCKPGDNKILDGARLLRARQLDTPTMLTIQRESSFVSSLVSYSVHLNGVEVGFLKNGQSMDVYTDLVENGICVSSYGGNIKPLYFVVNPGTNALIVFGPTKFKTELCRGIALLSDADVKLLSTPFENNGANLSQIQSQGVQPTPQ